MKPVAKRVADMRARRKAGLERFATYLPNDRLIEALIEDQFLKPWDADSPAAVRAAWEHMNATYITAVLGDDTE